MHFALVSSLAHLRRLLLFFFLLSCLSGLAPAQAQPEAFKFGEVDLELLEQVKQVDQKFADQGLVYRDAELNAYVERVGQSLLKPEDQLENVTWRFRVYRDPAVNAFALPNGSIYLFTGLLARVESEAQLAAVLAHEVVHVRHRHSYLSYRSYRKKSLTMNLIYAAASYAGSNAFGANIAAQFMLTLSIIGYTRELEKEADLTGVQTLAAAGYDPHAMVEAFNTFLDTYEVDLDGEPFYGDHPKTKTRIAYLNEWLSKATTARPTEAATTKGAPLGADKDRYQEQIEAATRHDIALAIDAGLYRTAVTLGQRLQKSKPDSAANIAALADAYAALGPREFEPTEVEKTGKGKRQARKRRNKLTLQEEERELAATLLGQEAQQRNHAEAERLYRRATELDPAYAFAWRGWGELAEKQKQPEPAAAAYRKYIDLQPAAMDRLQITRRLRALEAQIAPKQ